MLQSTLAGLPSLPMGLFGLRFEGLTGQHPTLYIGELKGDLSWVIATLVGTILMVVAYGFLAGLAAKFRPPKPEAATRPAAASAAKPPATGVQGKPTPPAGDAKPSANPNVGG